jgi:hypothetical protein
VSDKTKIVFSGGEELKVDEQPKQVRDRLSRKGSRFARFKKTGAANVDVWVAVGQVAYIEQIPEQSVSAPIADPGWPLALDLTGSHRKRRTSTKRAKPASQSPPTVTKARRPRDPSPENC